MKRFIAVCLLVICVALPIIGVAATCGTCGAPGAAYHTNGIVSVYDTTSHSIYSYHYTTCTRCHNVTVFEETFHLTEQGPHTMQHSKQWVTSTLTYEYDYCTKCPYRTTGTTIYH